MWENVEIIHCIGCFFDVAFLWLKGVYNFITFNYGIINNIFSIFTIFTSACTRIPIKSFLHTCFLGLLHSHRHLLLFHFWFDFHFLPWNLLLHSHDTCFVNVFDMFILVIILKAFKFISPVLFATHIPPDGQTRVSQLSLHLI